MDAYLASALDLATTVAGTRLGNIQIADARSRTLEIKAQLGFDEQFLTIFRRVPFDGHSICARAATLRHPVLVENVFTDQGFFAYLDIARRAGFHAVLSTPLIGPGEAFLGVMSLHFARGNKPTAETMRSVQLIADSTADQLARQMPPGSTA